MDDDDEDGSGVVGEGVEEGLKGLDAAGRGADPDDDRLLVAAELVPLLNLDHGTAPGLRTGA
jgi:hypothetical protein